MTLLLLLNGEPVDPITPGPVPSLAAVTGPRRFGTLDPAIIPAPIPSSALVVGPQAPLDVEMARPITPASILSRGRVVGPWLPVPADPLAPVLPGGPPGVARSIKVAGYPNTTVVNCRPQVNGVGSGTFSTPASAPALRTLVGFDVAGRRQFTGRVAAVVDPVVQQAEESGRLRQVTVEGLLAEWGEAVVLPDFGAQDLTRLGAPTQDARYFDWTMNGLGVDSADGVPRPNIIDSVGANANYGEPGELFPLPDVWPDPYARWMWVTSPARSSHPRGWCYFREPFGIPGQVTRIQVWLCAHDYAEAWLDGVPILTCDQPGVAQRIELEVRDDFHLLTIRAYNRGGRAGVLASILQVDDSGRYLEPMRRSGGGWKALAYPSRTFRLNPAQVLNRLRLEARRRRVANVPDWRFEFNATYDSAGRPWPANDPIVVQVGTTYLDVLAQLSTSLVDYATPPAGRVLRMWVKDKGTGRTRTSPWTEGVNLVGETRTRSLR